MHTGDLLDNLPQVFKKDIKALAIRCLCNPDTGHRKQLDGITLRWRPGPRRVNLRRCKTCVRRSRTIVRLKNVKNLPSDQNYDATECPLFRLASKFKANKGEKRISADATSSSNH